MILNITNIGSAGALMTILVYSVGCGTLMNGSQHYLAIVSRPSGARVTVDNRSFFDTPITAVLDKRAAHTVKIELEGYLPYEVEISRKLDGGVILADVFLTCAVGLGVDAITGGLYKLRPAQVRAELEKEGLGLIGEREILYISLVCEPPADAERIGTLIRVPNR